MEREESLAICLATEEVASITLLSELARAGIEYEIIKKPWDLFLLFEVVKNLSTSACEKLQKLQD